MSLAYQWHRVTWGIGTAVAFAVMFLVYLWALLTRTMSYDGVMRCAWGAQCWTAIILGGRAAWHRAERTGGLPPVGGGED